MKLLAPFLLASLLLLAACQQTADSPFEYTLIETGTPVNVTCPLSGEVVTPEGGSVSFHGSTIAFCCADCRHDFEKMTDAERTAALAQAGIVLPAK